MSIQGAGVYTDFKGLAELKADARERSPEALRETARQFEALFLQMMLKSMRSATQEGGLFDSQQTKFYQEMFDQQVALDLAGRGGTGLTQMLVRQLGGAPSAPDMPAAPSFKVSAPRAPAAADWAPATPAEFARDLWPHAERAAARLGVAPEVLIAQAALETGWGGQQIRHADGRSAYNLFGIKADTRWSGARVEVETTEYVDGAPRRERAAFRAYESLAQAFDDYARFLQDDRRYGQALAAAPDAEGYLRGLQAAGYATDPAYADKILDILGRGSFQTRVAELKNRDVLPIG